MNIWYAVITTNGEKKSVIALLKYADTANKVAKDYNASVQTVEMGTNFITPIEIQRSTELIYLI